jgi:hypothetical protein
LRKPFSLLTVFVGLPLEARPALDLRGLGLSALVAEVVYGHGEVLSRRVVEDAGCGDVAGRVDRNRVGDVSFAAGVAGELLSPRTRRLYEREAEGCPADGERVIPG